MSEIFKIVLTSGLTIFGGVIIYAFSQVTLKFFIGPIHEQWKTIGQVSDALIFYANIYSNPGIGSDEMMSEASQRLRQLATLLQSKTQLIPCYKFFERIGVVTKGDDIVEVSGELIGLSNSIRRSEGNGSSNRERRENILRLLKLRWVA